jgi:hypothetical protein
VSEVDDLLAERRELRQRVRELEQRVRELEHAAATEDAALLERLPAGLRVTKLFDGYNTPFYAVVLGHHDDIATGATIREALHKALDKRAE